MALFGLLIFFIADAQAHPQFIRHQYLACTACHTQARGSGMLNEYGKGISQAFSLPGGEYVNPTWKEKSGMGQSWDLQAQIRGAWARKFTPDYERFFPMQADLSARIQPTSKFAAEVTLARTPNKAPPLNNHTQDDTFAQYVFRRAVTSFDLTDESKLFFGRDLAPFGLGIDDHTAYIRKENRQGVTDFPTQLAWQLNTAETRAQVIGLAPSFQEAAANREWGMGGLFEKSLSPQWAVGGHGSYTESKTIKRSFVGAIARGGLGLFGSLLQFDVSNRENKSTQKSFIQYTGYMRASLWPQDWLETAIVAEYLGRHQSFAFEEHKYGTSIWAHLWRHLTLQLDARISRNQMAEAKSVMGQVYGNLW